MSGCKAFFKRHLLVVGFGVVIVPLLVLLGLQYRSLRALETALPAWRKEEMAGFLHEVVHETEAQYRRMAESALTISGSTIQNRVNGIVQVPSKREDLLPHLAGVTAHFRQQPTRGVRHYFVAVATLHKGRSWSAILFYDPVSQSLKIDPSIPEWFSIHLAFAPYGLKITQQRKASAEAVGIEQSPDQRFIFKPILDDEQRIIGVAGMVVDQPFFIDVILRETLPRVIAKHFPAESQEVTVTLHDSDNQLLFSNQSNPRAAPEAQLKYNFLFRDWALGVRARGAGEAQIARRLFVLNISLSVLMALLVSGGLWLALRTAAREIKLSQMQSDFVSNVSHELRTPLSSIQVFGELLKLGRVTESATVREFGAYIETECRRLTGLINNILDFSHLESGRKEYQFAPTNLRALIAETVKAYEMRLKHEGFVLHLTSTPTPLVAVDAEAIAQAFVNLLDNAAKYSGSARVIEVRVQVQREAVTIAVTDQGIGIPLEEQEKIFEKFYRVGSGLIHDVKGSGLGLSIVRHIVVAHGGSVTVTSALGQGSTFAIHLPMLSTVDKAQSEGVSVAMQPHLEGQ